jgi:hypothetical protein
VQRTGSGSSRRMLRWLSLRDFVGNLSNTSATQGLGARLLKILLPYPVLVTGLKTNSDVSFAAQRVSKLKPVSTVPFKRDTHFVGREDLMRRTDSVIGNSIFQDHSRVALVGLGGVG